MANILKLILEFLAKLLGSTPKAPKPVPAPPEPRIQESNMTTMTLGQAAMDVARENIGKKEATGNNDGAFVKMLQDFIDGPNSNWMNNQPWCAAFASWCIYQAADRHLFPRKFIKSASSSEIYARAKKDGNLLDKPEGYCIGLLRGDPDNEGKTHHHTFLANATVPADKEGKTIWGIDGNWKNQVMRTQHNIADADFVRIT